MWKAFNKCSTNGVQIKIFSSETYVLKCWNAGKVLHLNKCTFHHCQLWTDLLLCGRLVEGRLFIPRIKCRWGTKIETHYPPLANLFVLFWGIADIKRRSRAAWRWGKRDGGSWGKREAGMSLQAPGIRWMGEWEDAEKKGVREREKKKISST